MKWICEWFIINTLWNSKMICVAWILQLCLLSGPVMKEQTFVSTQNNTTANNSVCNWTEKGNNRQKQLSTSRAAAPLTSPYPHPLLWTPPPTVRWHTVMKKMTFFPPPILDLLQISCSVCGPGLFLCSEAWIPDLAMSWLHSAIAARLWGSQTAHHWMLLLSSVPFASDIFIFPMEWPTWFTPSLRGGMRSLMRSRPLASSKLVILCWGENPRMAERRKHI